MARSIARNSDQTGGVGRVSLARSLGGKHQWLHRPVITVLLAADIVFNARLTRLLEPLPLQPLILGGVSLLILVYLLIAFLRFYFFWVLLELAIFCIILAQMLAFEARTGIPPDFNSFFQYIWVFTLVVFVVAARDGMIEFIVRRLLLFSTAYAGLYIVLVAAYRLGALPQSVAAGIVSAADDRGARLFSYAIAVNFAWFAWLVRFRLQPGIKALAGMFVCLLASVLAMSRVSILFTLLLTVLYVAGLRARAIQWIAASIFCLVTVPNLYGLVDPQWNPYSYFAGDASGGYRLFEYDVARAFIWDDPVSAFGIAPGFKNGAALLLKSEVFGSDLGPVGVWFNYGVVAFALFTFGMFVACRQQKNLPAALRYPLFLTGCFLTAYACLSPLAANGGCVFFAVVMANALASDGDRNSVMPADLPGRLFPVSS